MRTRYSTKSFEKQFSYTGNDLGAIYAPNSTKFRVWAPEAQCVTLALYVSGNIEQNDLITKVELSQSTAGTWYAEVPGNLNGVFYTYIVTRDNTIQETIDPYAKACGVNGHRGMIVDLSKTDPPGWSSDSYSDAHMNPTDCIIYEISVRDMTSFPYTNIVHKGKYLGLAEESAETADGHNVGIDHIKSLGVTHVQVMPVYDFGSIEEHPSANNGSYNWGYDPQNYNIPEGSYSSDPCDGFCRINELKTAILSFHRAGIGVVMDVVYNHVFRADSFSINKITPGYFSRPGYRSKLSNASGCGNDTATERSMVKKYVIDSVRYWADEYHIDGFRFDLAGLLDIQTVQEITDIFHKEHPGMLIYGEGWNMPTKSSKKGTLFANQANAHLLPEFAFFNDSIRDAVCGPVFSPNIAGFAAGSPQNPYDLLDRFCGRTSWTKNPEQSINYISCHDNFTLYDRLSLSLPEATHSELAARCRLAASFCILSAGIPFFLSGEELLRCKRNSDGIPIGNSYQSSDHVNSIKYDDLNDAETSDTLRYYKGLISIRKHYAIFRSACAETIRRSVAVLPTGNVSLIAFHMESQAERFCIVFNTSMNDCPFLLPDGAWNSLISDNEASAAPIKKVSGSTVIRKTSTALYQQCKPASAL